MINAKINKDEFMIAQTTCCCLNGKYGVSFAKYAARTLIVLATIATCLLACAPASAVSLFHEDFDGYTKFPDEHPAGDPVNFGMPLISEGADYNWYGGRFQTPDGGAIVDDVAVQSQGGGGNTTPVGRVEDEAGLLFNISTVGYLSVVLEFDWRLFDASGDTGRVGYRTGTITGFDGNLTKNMIGEWTSVPWIQLDTTTSTSWSLNESFPLPAGESSVWVAFWLDNGESDFLKIDNIDVTAQLVPEPTTFVLAGFGAAAIGVVGIRRRRARNSAAAARALCARDARAMSDVSAISEVSEINSVSAVARARCA